VAAKAEAVAAQATAEPPAAQESGSAGSEGRGKGEIPGLTGEEVLALLNGRLLLTTFMINTEGIVVPLAEQWKLERVDVAADERRSFTFSSDEWTLILREPAADRAGVLYHAEISGPDLPLYIGDILVDGSVSPVQ